MKVRQGFVSNSSSSSFIIAVKNGKPCPHCGRSDLNVLTLLEHCEGGETGVRAIGTDAVLTYIEDMWGYTSRETGKREVDEYGMKHIRNIEEYVKNHPNAELAYIEVSYHDESLNDMIYSSKEIEIVEDLN